MALLPDFSAGQPVSADSMQEMSDALRRLTGSIGGQGNNMLDVTGATVQNSPPEDNFWIQITTPAGTNGGGARAAPYGWIAVARDGTAFDSLSYAHSGTTTANPAYEQNGKRDVPLNSVVRAWVCNDNGTPCMEFDAGALAENPCCPVYGGVYGDDCRCDCCGPGGGGGTGGGGTGGGGGACCVGVWYIGYDTTQIIQCPSGHPAAKPVWVWQTLTYPNACNDIGKYIGPPVYVNSGGYTIVKCGTPPPPPDDPCSHDPGGIGFNATVCFNNCNNAVNQACAQQFGFGTAAYNACVAAGQQQCFVACGGGQQAILNRFSGLSTKPPVWLSGGPQKPLINYNPYGGFYGGYGYGGQLIIMPAEGGVGNVSPGTSGNVLTSNGTEWVSSAPAGAGGQTVADTISADQNNYTFGGMTAVGGDNVVILSGGGVGGPWLLTGIAISQSDRTRLTIMKNTTAPNITLKHMSGSSSVGNKLNLGNAGTDITLNGDKVVSFMYDGTNSVWRVLSVGP